MKAKIKLDGDSIKQFFIDHGEKVALGVVGLITLMFIWSAFGAEGVPEQQSAEKLQDSAATARQRIDQAEPAPLPPAGFERVLDLPADVPENAFVLSRFNPPVGSLKGKRKTPATNHPLTDLHVLAGRAAIAYDDGTGAIIPKGKRYVVLTGLIPFAAQLASYEVALANASYTKPDDFPPRYAFYQVQWREVDGEPAADDTGWQEIDLVAAHKEQREWADQETPEVAHADYLLPKVRASMHFRLPPILPDFQWGDAGKHPRVPRAPSDDASQSAPEEPKDEPIPDFTGRRREINRALQEEPKTDGSGATRKTHRMFRFIHLGVEPGRAYQYRVRLVLENPNYRQRRRNVRQDVDTDAQLLYTTWSAASPIYKADRTVEVTRLDGKKTQVLYRRNQHQIPSDAGVLAASVNFPQRRSQDLTADVVGLLWSNEKAALVASRIANARRGQWLNLPKAKVSYTIPTTKDERTGESDIPLIIDHALVDIRGGRKLGGKSDELRQPGELLLIDAEGKLVVRQVIEDQPRVAANPTGVAAEESLDDPKGDNKPDVDDLLNP